MLRQPLRTLRKVSAKIAIMKRVGVLERAVGYADELSKSRLDGRDVAATIKAGVHG